MEQKGLLSTTAGKAIAVTVSILVVAGGIAGVSAITAHLDEQRVESQENYDQENNNQENNNQENNNQENNNQENTAQETADETQELLNEELNAVTEEEQEQQTQQEGIEYPEGFMPIGEYWCYEIQDIYKSGDIQSPLYYTPIVLEFIIGDDDYLHYEYDFDTKQYTITKTYSRYGGMGNATDWDHTFIGHLNEEGNLVVTHYERSNYKYSGDWQEIVLDDIEWVYVRDLTEETIMIEKQNVTADRMLCEEIQSAVIMASFDPEVLFSSDPAVQQAIADLENETDIYSLLSGTDLFTECVRKSLGVDSADELTLKSHNASGVLPVSAIRIRCVLDRSEDNHVRLEECVVWIEGSDASGLKGADPEAMVTISFGDH